MLGTNSANILCVFALCVTTIQDNKGATIRFTGGGLGFSVWPEYFFLSLSGPKYFFSNYHEPEYFFLKPYWARIFFSIQYKFGSNFSVEPQIGYKTIILRLFVVCLCVCPTAMTLSGITLPIPNTLQYHFI